MMYLTENKIEARQGYYPFGMLMPGRTWPTQTSANNTSAGTKPYRYGFNGKESDFELKSIQGSSVNYGSRIYDPRSGRWLSVDMLADKYADVAPFAFGLNTPIQAKDPDGKVVIFINGLHTGNGGTSAYWGGYDQRAMDKIGDHSARYVDGAMGGIRNTALWGAIGGLLGIATCSNVNLHVRMAAGEAQGFKDAAGIIANLLEGETIKIVTHSMGSGYGAGYEQGIQDYVLKNYHGEAQQQMLAKIKTAHAVDISAFQGESIPPPQDDVPRQNIEGGKDGSWMNLITTGKSMPYVKPIPGEENPTNPADAEHGHAIKDLSVDPISDNIGGAGTESKRPIEEGSNNSAPH